MKSSNDNNYPYHDLDRRIDEVDEHQFLSSREFTSKQNISSFSYEVEREQPTEDIVENDCSIIFDEQQNTSKEGFNFWANQPNGWEEENHYPLINDPPLQRTG